MFGTANGGLDGEWLTDNLVIESRVINRPVLDILCVSHSSLKSQYGKEKRRKRNWTDWSKFKTIKQTGKGNEQSLLRHFPADADSAAASKTPEIGGRTGFRTIDPSLRQELVGIVELLRQCDRINQEAGAGRDEVPINLNVLGGLVGRDNGDSRSPA